MTENVHTALLSLRLAAYNWLSERFEAVGEFFIFLGKIMRAMFTRPFRASQILQQMEFVGNKSFYIILLTGFFTGGVFGLQIGNIFKVFRTEGMMGGATGLALASELAPLVTGFLLAGRAGSAMTAEIATMVVGEQIDAMEAIGVDPIHYLVVPRVIASLFMIPALCGMFMLMGMVGAYLTGTILYEVDSGVFFDRLVELVEPSDVIGGLRKAFVFAFIISAVSCRFGLEAGGGAKGVGNATNRSVVQSLILILLTDFVISFLQVRWDV